MRLVYRILPFFSKTSAQPYFINGWFNKGQLFKNSSTASVVDFHYPLSLKKVSSILNSEITSQEDVNIEDFTEEDVEEVKALLKTYYYAREPLSLMLHLTYEDKKEAMGDYIKECIGDKVSSVARHQKTGSIVGCCLATIITRQQQVLSGKEFADKILKYNVKTRYDKQILDMLRKSVDLFKKYNIESILQLDHIAVNTSYVKLGIAKRLTRENENKGNILGCHLATAQATNIISQNLLRSFDYSEVFSIDYQNIRIDGKQILDLNKNLVTPSAKVFIRHL